MPEQKPPILPPTAPFSVGHSDFREPAVRTPDMSSSSRPSSANTTPRQGNRKIVSKEQYPTTGSKTASVSVSSRPTPKPPAKCPLLCCFYAEFDIKVGPKICYQSPANFMEQDIRKPAHEMEELLRDTFAGVQSPKEQEQKGADDLSIFDSCSEFIITGQELTGNILNLSTHQIHVLTRPTILLDEKYERNSLLFCVGFVLRRTEDPRPFRPALSKLAVTLQEMEVESQFLSQNRDQIQPLLNGILLALNSDSCECNMLLGKADVLNLKLFRPPKMPAAPVKDYSVPILLRRDWQVQAYDWDLSINWVSLHIDGVLCARQISNKAEVDMEMVRACLRVLKHHGVIALVDMFFYSNRYECTNKMVSKKHDNKLLQDAVEFVLKRPSVAAASTMDSSPELHSSSPGGQNRSNDLSPVKSSSLSSSFEQNLTIKEGHLMGGAQRVAAAAAGASYTSNQDSSYASCMKREDYSEMKNAVAEFFCGCHRGISIGELWIALVSAAATTSGTSVDWKKAFQKIDHRRLVTFGLVHGMIRRIHNFPLLLDKISDSSPPDLCLPSFPQSHDRSRFNRYNHQVERRKIATRAANMMDGLHCDDELACFCELPLEQIFALFPGKRIVLLGTSVSD